MHLGGSPGQVRAGSGVHVQLVARVHVRHLRGRRCRQRGEQVDHDARVAVGRIASWSETVAIEAVSAQSMGVRPTMN